MGRSGKGNNGVYDTRDRGVRMMDKQEAKLLPCPFCGGEARILVSDSEGNLRDDDYEMNPWSGLGYRLIHAIEENEGCPIAKYDCDGAEMGVYIYNSKKEAIEAWNRRVT